MIVISLVTGLMTSLIPNLTSNLVENDTKGIENRINKTYQIVLFFVIPMTVGLSILAEPVWTIFYGASKYGPIAYQFLVFVALATSLFTSTTMIVQVLKGNKVLFISLILGILSKIVLNVPFMYLFDYIGLEAFYGSIAATIFGFILPVVICFIYLKKNFKINFKPALKTLGNVLKISEGPLSTSTPYAKHAGKIIRPDENATNVSNNAIFTDSPSNERSFPI